MKIKDATQSTLVLFLDSVFEPDAENGVVISATQRLSDLIAFAKFAQFLSNEEQLREYARSLSLELEGEYRKQAEYEHEDGQRYRVVGAFSRALKEFAPHYGFKGQVYIVNGQISHQQFASIVTQRILIRDLFTRPHGEFTHAIQWLLLAYAFGDNVPELYKKSVQYKSTVEFDAQGGKKKVYMWNFLVDCFEGEENYQTNIFCKSFRCPQVFTEKLNAVLPSGSWLGEFLLGRRKKGLKGGAEPYADGHYQGVRTVEMKKPYLQRTIPNLAPGKPALPAYEEVSTNVYKKSVVELRRL